MEKDLKSFILDFYKAWKERNTEKVRSFYDDDVEAYADFKPISLQDMMNRLQFSYKKFLNVEYNVQDLFVNEIEGKIAVRMKQEYIFRDSNEKHYCESITLYKVKNNKIVEIWMSFYPNVDYTNNN